MLSRLMGWRKKKRCDAMRCEVDSGERRKGGPERGGRRGSLT